MERTLETLTTDVWYLQSASKHPGGRTKGLDHKYCAGSNYANVYMRDREQFYGDWNLWFSSVLLTRGIKFNGHTLVIGVNDGQEVERLPFSGPVVGVDLAVSALANGNRRGNRIGFVQANAANLPLPDEKFDNAICLRAYQVFLPEERIKYLQELLRTLKAGGVSVISIANGFFDVEKDEFVRGYHVRGSDGKDYIDETAPYREAQELEYALVKAGFKDLLELYTDTEIFVFALKPVPAEEATS